MNLITSLGTHQHSVMTDDVSGMSLGENVVGEEHVK